MSEFFVGYQPAPPGLQRFLRRAVAGLFAVGTLAAGLLLIGQQRFAQATFEYGTVHRYSGVVSLDPYPQLRGTSAFDEDRGPAAQNYLLVAPGKHGAGDLLAGLDGARVWLSGQRIFRDGTIMLEIIPDSIERHGEAAEPRTLLRELGDRTVSGEIVDSKCYLGVMNPGAGKVHRDCAARCLSGGIPPLLVSAEGRQYLLVDRLLRPFERDTLRPFIAERITIRGTVFQDGEKLLMAINPATLTPDD